MVSARACQLRWKVGRESGGRRRGGDERTAGSLERVIKERTGTGPKQRQIVPGILFGTFPRFPGSTTLRPRIWRRAVPRRKTVCGKCQSARTPKPSFFNGSTTVIRPCHVPLAVSVSGNKLGRSQSRRTGKSSRLFLLLGKNNKSTRQP